MMHREFGIFGCPEDPCVETEVVWRNQKKQKTYLLSTTGTKDVVWIFSAVTVMFHVEISLWNNSVDRSLSFGFVPKMKSSNQKYYDDDGKREPRNSYKKIFCGVKKYENLYGESAQVICTDEVRTAFYLEIRRFMR